MREVEHESAPKHAPRHSRSGQALIVDSAKLTLMARLRGRKIREIEEQELNNFPIIWLLNKKNRVRS